MAQTADRGAAGPVQIPLAVGINNIDAVAFNRARHDHIYLALEDM
jgi:hypothetical protein